MNKLRETFFNQLQNVHRAMVDDQTPLEYLSKESKSAINETYEWVLTLQEYKGDWPKVIESRAPIVYINRAKNILGK